MSDHSNAKGLISRFRRPRSRPSHKSQSTVSLPSPAPVMPGDTPPESTQARSISVPKRRQWWHPKSSSGTPTAPPTPTPPSESSSSRTSSWFRCLKSSDGTRAAAHRTTSDVPKPSDPPQSLVAPPPAPSDPGPEASGAPPIVSDSTTPLPYSPVQKAQEALEGAGRLNPRAAETIERVHGTWQAASSTAESWEGLVSKISAFSGIVDAIGEVHPYLKAVTGIINGIIKPVVAQVERDEKFEELLEQMRLAYDRVIRDSGTIARLNEKPASRQKTLLEAICRESEQCALFIQEQYIKTFWVRAARNTFNGDVDKKIDQYKSTFSSLRTQWQEEGVIRIEGDQMLAQLARLQHSGPSSQRACMPNTRVEVVKRITQWIDNPDSTRVLFVLGVAGSGKTSIANTVAEIGHARKVLGSFFAFSRPDSARAPGTLLGTIAHQLARWNEAYRDWLVGILKDDVMLADSPDIMRQWRRLIIEPATSIPSPGPVLVVIDAFDECPELSDNSRQRLLDCLTLHAAELPKRFRVLVTSRPLEKVSQAMIAPSVGRLDLSDFSATRDVRLFVRSQLPHAHEGGLSDQDCNAVADAAGGLFQWAATACRFLATKLAGTTMSAKLKANLERIVHGDPGRAQRPNGPPSLDALYATVLEDTFDAEDTTIIANFRCVVAAMLCAKPALSIDVLGTISDRARPSSSGAVRSVLASMGVVLEGVTSLSSPVRPMHLSFREFLLDASRSGSWHISEADIAHGHRILALGGLRVMANDLRFNMHSLPSSLSSEDEGRRKGPCPHPTLAYITPNLYRHLRKVLTWGIGDRNRDLFQRAWRRVLYNKMLFWMEWSLIRDDWDGMYGTLQLAQRMLTDKDCQFVEDAARHCNLLYWSRQLTPPHVYLSGLAFAPAKSLVRQHFMPHFRGIPTVRPLRETWKEIQKVPFSSEKPRLAWSTDCRYIRETSGFQHRCWDARTGDAVDVPPNLDWRYASLESADSRVKVSLSPVRGKLVANVERSPIACPADTTPVRFTIKIVNYYDEDASDLDTGCDADVETGSDGVETGNDGDVEVGHYCDNYNADVSPDGNWLVVVDGGHNLGLWDLRVGLQVREPVPICVEEGQLAATFSPDSREVVSSGILDDVHYVFPIDRGTGNGDIHTHRWDNVNFKPQPQIDANGEKFPDAYLRSTEPDIRVVYYYYGHLTCQPGVRLALGGLRVDYTNVYYGTEWAHCYAGTLEAEESEDEYAGADVEMEETKVESSGSKGKIDESKVN